MTQCPPYLVVGLLNGWEVPITGTLMPEIVAFEV